MMRLIFLASEAQYEPHEETGVPPISLAQPAEVEIVCDDFFQITYGSARVGPHGDDVAYFDGDFWLTRANLHVIRAVRLDGRELDPGTVQTENMLFTDISASP